MKRSLLIICIIAILVSACGCTAAPKSDERPTPTPSIFPVFHVPMPDYVNATSITPSRISPIPNYTQVPDDKLIPATYVFIEHERTLRETMIESNVSNSSLPLQSFTGNNPEFMGNPYMFNKSAGSLWYYAYFGNGINTIAILGETNIFEGLENQSLYQIYNIDKTPADEDSLQVSAIDDNGTVRLRYHNESITLKPGSEWTNVTSGIAFKTMETRPVYQNGSYKSDDAMVKMNVTTVDVIRNYGILKKSDTKACLGIAG